MSLPAGGSLLALSSSIGGSVAKKISCDLRVHAKVAAICRAPRTYLVHRSAERQPARVRARARTKPEPPVQKRFSPSLAESWLARGEGLSARRGYPFNLSSGETDR